MSRYSDLVSKAAREMGRYVPNVAATRAQISSRLIKLDSNENPFGPSPRGIEAMHAAFASAHEYPDDDCATLRERLAARHEVKPEQVLVTAGAAGMLGLLCQTLLAPGLNAVTSERSFIVYRMAVHAAGARMIETSTRDDGFDLTAIQNAINADTRLVLLANPNNPTGTMIEAAEVEAFLAKVPPHVVVVLDEAYFEFAEKFAAARQVVYSRAIDYVRNDSNVVVLRTFSKVHGLAGLRIGYGMGPADLLGYCARMANTYSVSSVAQAAALAALDDHEHVERTVTNNTEQTKILENGLSALCYRVVPTSANFVYCDVGEDAAEFARRLREKGVSVRPLGAWGSASSIRVSVGTPEQNRVFLDSIQQISSHVQK
jgi:histidinol-phosphate aminotransferase